MIDKYRYSKKMRNLILNKKAKKTILSIIFSILIALIILVGYFVVAGSLDKDKTINCEGPDCEFAQTPIIFLNITRQDSFEKYIEFNIYKENETRFAVCYQLNGTFKTEIDTCNALSPLDKQQCFNDLKTEYSKDILGTDFDTSITNLKDYKKQILTSNIEIESAKIDLGKEGCIYVNLLNYNSSNLSASVGEKFKIGYNTAEIETIETANSVGYYSSIAIDSNNIAHISHYDNTNYDLRYCNNTGGDWSCVAVETTNSVGYYSSIAIDSNNIAHISHRDSTNDNLKYCNNTGGDWSCVAVETTNSVGYYSSIAIDSNNIAHISHYDATNDDLRYCNNINNIWNCKKIEDVGSVFHTYGRGLAIKKGRLVDSTQSDNFAHMSYYYSTTSDLHYAKTSPYIDIISPIEDEIITTNDGETVFNITTWENMTESNLTLDDPNSENITLTKVNDTYFYYINSTMLDGHHNFSVISTNYSGVDRHSEMISFDVDSVNITVCRDLTVERTYELNNDVDGADCFIVKNNLSIDLKGYTINSTTDAIDIQSSSYDNLRVFDGILNGTTNAINTASGSINNSVINVTYSGTGQDSGSGEVYRKWYFQTNITDKNANSLADVNLTIKNITQDIIHSELTDANGMITQQELNDYINDGGTKTYYVPYNISVTKTDYVTNSSAELNMSEGNTMEFTIEMDTTLSLDIEFPTDGLFLNYNTTIDINYTYSNATNLDTCWYSTDEGLTNTSTTCMLNFTLNLSDNNYLLYLYLNDSTATEVSDNVNFTVDTIFPVPSFGADTLVYGENVSESSINITVTVTELNFANITYEIYNDTDNNYTNTFYDEIYSLNLTGRRDGNYYYNVSVMDNATNLNYTETRLLTLDTTKPYLTQIDYPLAQSYSYNKSLDLNFTAIDETTGIFQCWFNIINSTNDYMDWEGTDAPLTSNITLTNCQNTTFNISRDGTYTLNLYTNDSANNFNSSLVIFSTSTTAPAIVLDYPADNTFFKNGSDIFFNFTAIDSDGLSDCELWGNWTGIWTNFVNWTLPESDVQNFTVLNITNNVEGVWNIWCNDTLEQENWALNNFTIGTDTIYPNVEIITANGSSVTGLSIAITYNITDTNLNGYKYSWLNGTGDLSANTSFALSGYQTESVSVETYGTWHLYIYGTDKAGWENSTSIKITFNEPPPGGTGAGAGAEEEEEEVIVEEAKEPEPIKLNLDDLIFSCFAGTKLGDFFGIPDTPEAKANCIKNHAPVIFWIAVVVAGITLFTIFIRTKTGKKHIKIYKINKPSFKSRRKSWISKYVK